MIFLAEDFKYVKHFQMHCIVIHITSFYPQATLQHHFTNEILRTIYVKCNFPNQTGI